MKERNEDQQIKHSEKLKSAIQVLKISQRRQRWDLLYQSQQNKMQISSMINGLNRLSAERCKASDSVHYSFLTLKEGFT